jgi:membrane-associated protease RseP (regulator of RpoE activity)
MRLEDEYNMEATPDANVVQMVGRTADEAVPAVTEAAAEVMEIQDVMAGGQTGSFRERQSKGRAGPEQLLGLMLGGRDGLAGAVRIRGRLTMPSDQAYARLADRLRPLGYTPILRKDQDGQGEVLLAVRGQLRAARQRVALALTLFGLTAVSCLYVGALYAEGRAIGELPTWLPDGLPFAASLLAILLCHEFGHYLVARRLGVPTSLPYFLPLPISPFGTLGSVINMTAPPRNRRQLLAIATAGPLAGLIVALPVLWIGLSQSHLTPWAPGTMGQEGNSLLYLLIKYLQFGLWLPSAALHTDVQINSVAWAGWTGLFVTALNLMPVGQLDGGHIFDALAGERVVRIMFWVVLGGMALLCILWPNWLLWVGLIFLFGRLRVPPLDDVTVLTPAQRALAVALLIVFVLVFTPIPLT